MKSKFVKGLSVLLIALFGLYFAACGKASDRNGANGKEASTASESEAATQAGVREEKTSEYRSFFEPLELGSSDSYVAASAISDNLYYAIIEKWEMDSWASDFKLHKINLVTKEETVYEPIPDMENAYLREIFVNEDGSINLIKEVYSQEAPAMYLVQLSPDGILDYSKEIPDNMFSGEYVQSFLCSKDKMYFVLSDRIIICDKEGNKLKDVKTDSWINNAFLDSEGYLQVSYYSEAVQDMVVKKLNPDTGSFEEGMEGIPANSLIVKGKDGKTYAVSDNGVLRLNEETGEYELLFLWVNVDLSMVPFNQVQIGEDGSVFLVNETYEEDGVKYEVVTVKEVQITDENRREDIVCGCLYLDWNSREQVIKYNRNNDKYHVELKVYSEETDDYDVALDKMKMDIVSGNVLDMVWLDDYSFGDFVKADVFEDLNPYFDASYNREDFFTNILEAYETDGKLYGIADSFYLQAFVGRKSVIGDKGAFTLNDFIELRNKNRDSLFMAYATKEDMLLQLIRFSESDLIDCENASCNFASDEFISFLTFSNTFPKEYANIGGREWELLKKGEIILSDAYLGDFMNAEIYNEILNGDIIYVGYPTDEGSGISIQAENLMSVVKNSPKKEAAWEYIKTILDSDDENGSYGFPIRKSVYNDIVEREMKVETYIDPEGVEHKESRGGVGMGDTMFEYYCASKETVDQVTKAIESASAYVPYGDEKIYEIVSEEAQPFFEGQKTAEDVAGIIQNRVSIYMAEQY